MNSKTYVTAKKKRWKNKQTKHISSGCVSSLCFQYLLWAKSRRVQRETLIHVFKLWEYYCCWCFWISEHALNACWGLQCEKLARNWGNKYEYNWTFNLHSATWQRKRKQTNNRKLQYRGKFANKQTNLKEFLKNGAFSCILMFGEHVATEPENSWIPHE